MWRRFWAAVLTAVGFVSSLAFPLWAVFHEIRVLRMAGEVSVAERVGMTAGGLIMVGFIVALVFWKYFSHVIERTLKPGRTPLSFFVVAYTLVLCLKLIMETLEAVFLGGVIGSAVAVVCYFVADILKGRRDES